MMDRRRKSDLLFGASMLTGAVLFLEMLLLHGSIPGMVAAAFYFATTAVGWKIHRKTFPRLPQPSDATN